MQSSNSGSNNKGFQKAVSDVEKVGNFMPDLLMGGISDEKKIQQAVKTATTMWQSNVQCLSHIIALKAEIKESKAEAEAVALQLAQDANDEKEKYE